jgi:hypothetical protein
MKAWNDPDWLDDWNQALARLNAIDLPRDRSPAPTYAGERGEIPRTDLPYGTLRWQGSSGSRAVRATLGGQPSPDYYKLVMPAWAFALAPSPLNAQEAAAVGQIPH